MKRTKYLTVVMFALFSAYTCFALLTNALPTKPTICQQALFGAIATWDSGCFYRAVYRQKNTVGQIEYEKYKLNVFMQKGGFAHTVLWYRSQFHQRFKDYLEVSFDDIEEMHWRYTIADPAMVDAQVAFWKYLTLNNEMDRAQRLLDKYCQIYIQEPRAYLLPALEEVFAEEKIALSLDQCAANIAE